MWLTNLQPFGVQRAPYASAWLLVSVSPSLLVVLSPYDF